MSLSPCCVALTYSRRATAMHGHGSIVETVGTFSGPSFRGRPIKFTPERIQQIKNLVERGKSREDIAELVGVTVGSLAVTCSKLGISLRRRMVNNGVSVLRPTKASSLARTSILECGRETPSHPEEVATSTCKNDVAEKEAGTPSQVQAQAVRRLRRSSQSEWNTKEWNVQLNLRSLRT